MAKHLAAPGEIAPRSKFIVREPKHRAFTYTDVPMVPEGFPVTAEDARVLNQEDAS